MKKEKQEDDFSGRSWLNILAVVVLFAGLLFPFTGRVEFASLASLLMWYAFVVIITLAVAGAARTQERLARIEKHLGIQNESTENPEQEL